MQAFLLKIHANFAPANLNCCDPSGTDHSPATQPIQNCRGTVDDWQDKLV
jgi:hypothetical protein